MPPEAYDHRASGLRWEFYWDKIEDLLERFLDLLKPAELEVISLRYLGGMTLDLSYTGVVSPTEIKMTGDFMGMPFEFTVKKA